MSAFWGFEDPQSWVPVCYSASNTDVFEHTGKEEIDVPGLELTIPEAQAGTQILVQLSLSLNSSHQYGYARLYRNDSLIALGDAAGSRTSVTISTETSAYTNDKYNCYGNTISYLDTIPTAGDIRYAVRIANSYDAAAVTYINRSAYDHDGSYSHRGVSTLTAITLRNGIATAGPPGPRGAPGQQGKKGDPGTRGPAGDRGPKGDVGPAGPQGENGPAGGRGAKGDVGPAGPQGKEGPAGQQGQKGEPGAQGESGRQGPRGATGSRGADGPQGPAGGRGLRETSDRQAHRGRRDRQARKDPRGMRRLLCRL